MFILNANADADVEIPMPRFPNGLKYFCKKGSLVDVQQGSKIPSLRSHY